MSDERCEEFEAWFARCNPEIGLTKTAGTGAYLSTRAECSWEAWQASRAALVVELPNIDDFPDYEGGYQLSEFYKALESTLETAGAKVKP